MRNSGLTRRPTLWRLAALAAATAAVLLAGAAARPPAAAAGGPGVWTDVSGPVGSLLVQPRVARDPSGVLHVVWITQGTPQDLMYRPIAADGVAGGKLAIATGWPSLGNPAVVYQSGVADGLRVFAGGVLDSSGSHEGLSWWSSADGGAAWTLQPGVISGPGGTAYSSDVAAAVTPAGVFQTWFSSAGVFVHRSVSPGTDYNVNDVGNYGYSSALAYNGVDDRLYVVAAYNATGKQGLWAREIDQATGDALGASFQLPGSTSSYGGGQEFAQKQMPVPATGLPRQGAIVFAYPTGYPASTTMRVWRLDGSGTTTTTTLATGGGEKQATAVAADPSGRVWVAWSDSSGTRRHVYACRSNPGATAWGKTVSVLAPSGTETLWQLAADAQAGRLDVLGQFTSGGDNVIYHTQLTAGLSVSVSPAKARVGITFTATVKVADAGVAVGGATVKIGTRTATTDASGTASLKLKPTKTGSLSVTVTKADYAAATASIKITP